MAKYCKYCGTSLHAGANFCDNCGASVDKEESSVKTPQNPEAKSRVVAGILGIFFGGLGIHNFYLGYNDKGVIQIVVSFLTCGIGSLWGFIEGILILCGNVKEDANGVKLTD